MLSIGRKGGIFYKSTDKYSQQISKETGSRQLKEVPHFTQTRATLAVYQ